MNYSKKLKDYNRNLIDNQNKLQLDLQQQILNKLKQLEDSTLYLDNLKTLNIKCCNSNTLISSTRSGPYGYLPGLIGNNETSKLVQYGELGLLMLILFLWIISIMVCLNRYSKLRSLYPVVPPHKYTNKGPMHIEEIKVIKNEQDAVIYKKIIPHKSSQATLSRGLKSNSGFSSNTIRASIKEKFRRSLSEPNDITNAENTTLNLIQKNSIKYSAVHNENTCLSNNLNSTTTNHSPSLSIDSSRINILHKTTKPTYFSIDNYRLPKCETQRQDSLFKRNDPKIISMKRSLFAKSKVNLFKTKDPFTSNHITDKKNSIQSSKSNKSGSLTRGDTPTPSKLISDPNNSNRRMTIQDESHLLAPNWVSQTTIEKIRENLMDLHHLITMERRPSLLQLSKISKSESNIKTHKKSDHDKLKEEHNEENRNDTSKKPISLSLQNPNRSTKRYDFV